MRNRRTLAAGPISLPLLASGCIKFTTFKDNEAIQHISEWLHTALAGHHVRLEPLRPEHADGLSRAAADGDLWKLWYTVVPRPSDVATEIERRLSLGENGSMMPFTVIDTKTNSAIGMTTFMNVSRVDRRVEIGSTWYAKTFHRTAINTEAKSLLLGYAFDRLACNVVEFRTSFFNRRSRTAIERLGAKFDGVLRSHQINSEGISRDVCVYSIIASEWPAVRRHLQHLLEPSPTTLDSAQL